MTLTTVGYGDVYPVTVAGRIFTFFMLLIGLGTISIPVSYTHLTLPTILRV